MTALVIGIFLLILLALLISGKLRVVVKGILGVFVEDLAKSPEGAKAIYNQAIEKAQDDYSRANDTLLKITGQLDSAQRDLTTSQAKLKDVEAKCENFAKAGQIEKVKLYAQERLEILDDVEVFQRTVKELTPMSNEAKQINNAVEEKLKKLQKEKNRVVADLNLNKQLKTVYDDLDGLKNTTNIDKLLDSVKTGARETREMAVGARVVHENKLSTKITNADVEAKGLAADDYTANLMKKYQK